MSGDLNPGFPDTSPALLNHDAILGVSILHDSLSLLFTVFFIIIWFMCVCLPYGLLHASKEMNSHLHKLALY